MPFPNIFTPEVAEKIISRINQLTPGTAALWGKMDVGQMLAHLCVTYELVYENKHKKPGAVMRFFLRTFVKKMVTGEKPYKKSNPTAPMFKMAGQKNFEAEKNRLIDYIRKTQQMGADYFHNREYPSFGVMTKDEYNAMFYKHLDHHLSQFGA